MTLKKGKKYDIYFEGEIFVKNAIFQEENRHGYRFVEEDGQTAEFSKSFEIREIPTEKYLDKECEKDCTIEFRGVIKDKFWRERNKIKLIQENGYEIDLVARFNEIKESFPENPIQVSYYIADKPHSKDELIKMHLESIYGEIEEAEYDCESIKYSEITSEINYTTDLKIGGHDLYAMLSSFHNKFLFLQIKINEKK